MKTKIIATALCFVLTASVFASCGKKNTNANLDMNGVSGKLTVYGGSAEKYKNSVTEICSDGIAFFGEEGSLHVAADGTDLKLDDEKYQTVKKCYEIKEATSGAFDPSAAPITALWNIKKASTPPDPSDIAYAVVTIATDSLVFDDEEKNINFKGIGTGLDMGVVVDGFACKKGVDKLTEKGCKAFKLNVGRCTAVFGAPDDFAYVGVHNPIATGNNVDIGKIKVNNAYVATACTFDEFFECNGSRYHWIIDPRTGYQTNSDLMGASVISDDPVYAQALAYAVVVLGTEDSASVIEKSISDGKIKGVLLIGNNCRLNKVGDVTFDLTAGEFLF